MPMELRPGLKVPIPCRHCGQSMIPFEVSEGMHPLACPRCGLEMQVEVYRHEAELRIRTASRGTAQKAKPSRS